MLLASLQGEPPLALGLSTQKALSTLKQQLEAVLDEHLKEQKKRLTWKVGQSRVGMAEKRGARSQGPGSQDPTETSLKIRKSSGFLLE